MLNWNCVHSLVLLFPVHDVTARYGPPIRRLTVSPRPVGTTANKERDFPPTLSSVDALLRSNESYNTFGTDDARKNRLSPKALGS
ncbi:hypothetical protein CROQUDRAFT_91484 [Cronartium quercuum f. sp. fusiforme G11]|uniref:Secreted protein n=1 Tax=Cronartium quercuum f. sp. fusiforme G11 TaxID=708437 RepID=A0A9P6NPV1_9BASI|nr:hypothetical protein CROQUDRAFT_91484 [Cronartium quercuum f. sp. fusiforme G11]